MSDPTTKPESISKLVIGTVDHASADAAIEIGAQYNPKELALASTSTWNKHPNAHGDTKGTCGFARLDWGGTEPQTITLDLTFDGFEDNKSVRDQIDKLISLTQPWDMSSSKASLRRPPLCVAVWGSDKEFRCVVTAVTTKITMFAPNGLPLRAICTVALKEADVATMWADDMRADKLVASHSVQQALDLAKHLSEME
jgi:hypothetical protein